MFEVGLYYIASNKTTYCTPTPFFSDTVKCIAHGRIIRRIRYCHRVDGHVILKLGVYTFTKKSGLAIESPSLRWAITPRLFLHEQM